MMGNPPSENEAIAWDRDAAVREMLGYLNFSEGKPDPRFQRHLSAFYRHSRDAAPWAELHQALRGGLAALEGSSQAFRETQQASAVLSLVFDAALRAYRGHHAEQLFHLSDRDLFQPFFLARVFEAVLAEGPPWNQPERIVRGALDRLNDFLGHRPIAVLENRQKSEPYAHERVRPIPLYIRGAGTAAGPYEAIVARAIEILAATDCDVLAQAHFDPDRLDELALDPRAYDHSHPVNQRPNYVFGEWDPHHIDNQGRYRRFVLRGVTIDALLDRVRRAAAPGPAAAAGAAAADGAAALPAANEALFEAAAVLAGTILMASGMSGSGPDTHDSSTTLDVLVPRIALYRDGFYTKLLARMTEPHAERVRREAAALRQPFAAARQDLNQYLARRRAAQLQHARLALLFADMGYADASDREADRIPAASIRMRSSIQCRIAAGRLAVGRGETNEAARLLGEIEDLLERAIECGAMADPWNMLGFQAQFSIFAALENSVFDRRVEQLVEVMDELFTLEARTMAEAAARGDTASVAELRRRMRRRAAWWDRFASVEVAGLRRVHGRENVQSAEHVADALAAWHAAGEAAGDIAFWRARSGGFRSPRAYAQVVEPLLDKGDYVAAMALLMHWLGQVEQSPLEDGPFSFRRLARRWMDGVCGGAARGPAAAHSDPAARWELARKFFDYLEANAEDQWFVPALEYGRNIAAGPPEPTLADPDKEPGDATGLFDAAYEGMTYRDSARDGHEGEMLEGGPPGTRDFELDVISERVAPRLDFLSTLAQLWQIIASSGLADQAAAAAAASKSAPLPAEPGRAARGAAEHHYAGGVPDSWLAQARTNQRHLAQLLDAAQACGIPTPLGSHDSLVEYDRRRMTKDELVDAVITTSLETSAALGALVAARGTPDAGAGMEPWQLLAAGVESAWQSGRRDEIRTRLPALVRALADQPLVYVPAAKGGNPQRMLAAKCVERTLGALAERLPRAGLLRETYHVLRNARSMEARHPTGPGGITEFDRLFRLGFRCTIEALVESGRAVPGGGLLLEHMEAVVEPFLKLWLEHSHTVRLSSAEQLADGVAWDRVRRFIESYGHELFTPRFLTFSNLRAIVDQGVQAWLRSAADNPEQAQSIPLLEALGKTIAPEQAAQDLQLILRVFLENYDAYKDYNSTTTHSDYGERFFILFDFLRLRASYERVQWNLQPVVLAHEILARRGETAAARAWQNALADKTAPVADSMAARLRALEAAHGVRLPTVADRIRERFVKPLALDRIRALIPPAVAAASHGDPAAAREAWQRFEDELARYASEPSGAGLDVPAWIRSLEQEVARARNHSEPDPPAWPGGPPLSLEELEQQIKNWEQPLSQD